MWFWQTLVLAGIGGRTVSQAQASMSRAEFCDWFDRYDRQPFDDRHRYHRPAAWLAMKLDGTQPSDSLQWLTNGTLPVQTAPQGVPEGPWSQADLATFSALGMGRKG